MIIRDNELVVRHNITEMLSNSQSSNVVQVDESKRENGMSALREESHRKF